MREYAIEYADHRLLKRIVACVGGYLLVIAASVMAFVPDGLLLAWGAVAGMLITFTYLLANPSKIRKNGVILINYDRIVFGMASGIRVINLADVAKYRIAHWDGTSLKLTLKNGSIFRIAAHHTFCDANKLECASLDMEHAIQRYFSINAAANLFSSTT